MSLPVRDTGDAVNMAISCVLNLLSGISTEHACAMLSKNYAFLPASTAMSTGMKRCF